MTTINMPSLILAAMLIAYVQSSEEIQQTSFETSHSPSVEVSRPSTEKAPFPDISLDLQTPQEPLVNSNTQDLNLERSRYNTIVNINGRPRRRYRPYYYYRTGQSDDSPATFLRQREEQALPEEPFSERRQQQLLIYWNRPRFPFISSAIGNQNLQPSMVRQLEESFDPTEGEGTTKRKLWSQILSWLIRPRSLTSYQSVPSNLGTDVDNQNLQPTMERQLEESLDPEGTTERKLWSQILSWLIRPRSLTPYQSVPSSLGSGDEELIPDLIPNQPVQGADEEKDPVNPDSEKVPPSPNFEIAEDDQDATLLLRACAPNRNHSVCRYFCRIAGFRRGCFNTRNVCICRR